MNNRHEGAKQMKKDIDYFNEAIPMTDYVARMTQPDLKAGSEAIYRKFTVPQDGFVEQLRGLRILAITEDWCGDAMLNNPIVQKVAEAAGIEMRAAYRDADTDLIDRYLTNGGRAIPVYLFFNEAGDVVAKWGPRAPELQQMVIDARATLPDKEDPTFEAAQATMYGQLRQQYIDDEKHWSYVYEDVKRTVEQAL